MNKKKLKKKQLIKKIAHDIFNVNSKLFIKQYLLLIINNNKYNSELLSEIKNNVLNIKYKSLFNSIDLYECHQQIIYNFKHHINNNHNFLTIANHSINNNYDKFYRFIMSDVFLHKHIFSFYEMCIRTPQLFSNINLWYVFGCPLSTDLDLCIVVDKKEEGIPLCPNYKSIVKLFNSVKTNKILDCNFITIDYNEHRITSTKKGEGELVNIILATYKYHRQDFPLVELDAVQIDILNKMRSISKLILDDLNNLVDNYQELRMQKKIAYSSGTFEMIEFSFVCFKYFKFNNIIFKKDFLKKIVMKIIQLILAIDCIYEYTKIELAHLISKKYDNSQYEQHSLYYLLRGTMGIENYSFIEFLFQEFKNIFVNFKCNFDKRTHIVFLKNELLNITIPNLPKILFEQFLESPTVLQEHFNNEYLKLYPDSSINQICELVPCKNNDFIDFLKTNNLFDKFYLVSQRSDEWHQLLNYHSCGRNSVVIGKFLKDRYHLFRGIIGEYIIQTKIKTILNTILGENDYQFIEVGMIVTSKHPKTSGVSPDGLLWSPSTNKIIFIEVKCLKNKNICTNYFRELSMSKLQLQRAEKIMNYNNIYKKLSIICWFENENIHIDVFDSNF
jgi:hypothetical protein